MREREREKERGEEISRYRFKGSLELRVAFESGTDGERTGNEERGALSVDKQKEGRDVEEEKEKDECSIVRLEYPLRRNCRDGRVGSGRKERGKGGGREGDSDPSQKRHSKESTRRAGWPW